MAIDIEAPGASQAELETAFRNLAYPDFANDPATTIGLTYGIKGGSINFDACSDQNLYTADTVTLLDDTLNVLYLCPDLGSSLPDAVMVHDANVPGPFLPVNNFILAFVTTVGGEITSIVDKRCLVATAYQAIGGINDLGFVKLEVDAPFDVVLKPGVIATTAGPIAATGTTVLGIPDDDTSYIEIGSDGAITHNNVGWTSGKMALLTVTLAAGALENVTDYRAFLPFVARA